MYDQFYHFNAEPFRLSPDHAFAYAHKGYVKARAYMAYAFMRAEGFVMITGRPGTGKTTLVGALVDHLAGEDVSVANLVCTQLQADDLLKLVAYEFGIGMDVVDKGQLLQHLTSQLKAWHRDGRRALLIVDEAQDLSVSAMEELRLLTNIQVDGKPLLQIFLLGQPELKELVLSPSLEQVHQRIVAASHLRPLELDETEAYIVHRLEVVGWRGDPSIKRSIYPLIHKYSEGIPRRINLICSRLLLQSAVEQRHTVDMQDLKEVLTELQEENLAAGSSLSQADFQQEEEPDPSPPAEPEGSGSHGDDSAQDEPPAVVAADGAESSEDSSQGNDSKAQLDQPGRESGRSGNGPRARKRLKLIDGAASRTRALRTGTTGDIEEAVPLQMEVALPNEPRELPEDHGASEDVPEQPEEHEGPGSKLKSAPLSVTEGSVSQPRFIERETEPVDPAGVAQSDSSSKHSLPYRNQFGQRKGPDSGGYREIVVILAISVALVAWAVTGFDLSLFLD